MQKFLYDCQSYTVEELKVGDQHPITYKTITEEDLKVYEFAVQCIPGLKDYIIVSYDGIPFLDDGEGFSPFKCKINYDKSYCPLIVGKKYNYDGDEVEIIDLELTKLHSRWKVTIKDEFGYISLVEPEDLEMVF